MAKHKLTHKEEMMGGKDSHSKMKEKKVMKEKERKAPKKSKK